MKFKRDDLVQMIEEADDKSTAIIKVVQILLDEQEHSLVKEYQTMFSEVEANKANAAKFNLRQLTKEERSFYQAIEEGSITGNEQTMLPDTTVNYVFEDLKRSRDLFQFIDFTPAGLKKWIIGEVTGGGGWGALDAAIADEVKAALSTIDLDAHKYSAFSLIPLGVIDLGYEWMDKYVREILIEDNADGLEEGFVAGDGKNSPIGYIRKLTGAVDGVYAERTAVKIDNFTAAGMGAVLAGLTNGGKRKVKEVVLIVNPEDDFTLVKPASQFLTATGENREVFPIKTHVVQAFGIPQGKAVLTLPNAYSAGITQMGVYKDDSVKFLDHMRAYKVVTYGNGRIKAENMAAYLDISDLAPLALNVTGLVLQEGEAEGA